jgi:hypothetical protein
MLETFQGVQPCAKCYLGYRWEKEEEPKLKIERARYSRLRNKVNITRDSGLSFFFFFFGISDV